MATLSTATARPGVALAVSKITQQLRRALLDRQSTHTEGQVIVSFLEEGNVQTGDLPALLSGLRETGVEAQFFQTAHPRWGMYVRTWLRERGVPWETVHAHYVYDARDSVDFLAGFLAGMGVALADLPIMLAKLGQVTIEGKLVEEAKKFFDAIEQLWERELKGVLEEFAAKWLEEFDELIYQLEWFKAGYKLGNAVTNVVIFGKGAAKLIASLPKFIRLVPAAAKEIAAFIDRTSGLAVRTAQEAILFFRTVSGMLYVVPDLRFSRLLPTIVSPGELRKLLSAGSFRVLTKSGFELIYVESTRGATILRSGVLPTDFVSETCVVVRRNGKIVARIYNPRSLAHAWKDLTDDDIAGAIETALRDPNVPPLTLPAEEMRKLVDRALKNSDFATTAASLNLRLLAEDFIKAVSKRADAIRQQLKVNPKAIPSAPTFGTLVESDMKPILKLWQARYPHLRFWVGESLKSILGERLPSGSKLLDITVEEFVSRHGKLAEQLGFDGKNLARVLAADGKTRMGDLKLDLFIEDAFGHQGVVLDWTSGLNAAHFGKTLLYHAALSEVLSNMRLPLGEMFHYGFQL
jgi:hypothetical protein